MIIWKMCRRAHCEAILGDSEQVKSETLELILWFEKQRQWRSHSIPSAWSLGEDNGPIDPGPLCPRSASKEDIGSLYVHSVVV